MNVSSSTGFKHVDPTSDVDCSKIRRKRKPKGVNETHLNFDQFDSDIGAKAYKNKLPESSMFLNGTCECMAEK